MVLPCIAGSKLLRTPARSRVNEENHRRFKRGPRRVWQRNSCAWKVLLVGFAVLSSCWTTQRLLSLRTTVLGLLSGWISEGRMATASLFLRFGSTAGWWNLQYRRIGTQLKLVLCLQYINWPLLLNSVGASYFGIVGQNRQRVGHWIIESLQHWWYQQVSLRCKI